MPTRWRRASGSVAITLSPASSTSPESGSCNRFTQRSRVDLPEPDGPITHAVWPRSTRRSTPRSTSLVPKDTRRSRTSTLTEVNVAPSRGGPWVAELVMPAPSPR